jgi:hypothetical protein
MGEEAREPSLPKRWSFRLGVLSLKTLRSTWRDQRLTLWKFDTGKWPDSQGIDKERFRSWLAALDDFRNWLIREAA